MNRRQFLTASAAATIGSRVNAQDDAKTKLRVGIIGHTGRGNYGHGLDTVWIRIPGTEIVAVADADQAGLAKAKKRLKTENGFASYREMIANAKPDIVSVCPRHADQHRDMAIASMEGGAKGIYIEKPFCRTPAEADAIADACKKHGAKLAVAHRNRYHPVLAVIDKLIADEKIGRLLEIRGRGKGDRRGGAEDLWVLGSHVLDLMHYFGGGPKSCSAVMLQNGKRVTKADVKDGAEGLGPLAGNELHARYEMSKGVIGYFDSIANDGTKNQGFGLRLVGSEGVIDIKCDRSPLAHLIPGNPFGPVKEPRPWIPISTNGPGEPETREKELEEVIHHDAAAKDLIAAMREDREPLCGVREGAMTVEMICAVFESHRQEGRAVSIPLSERGSTLTKL